jgi:hypothetical protein
VPDPLALPLIAECRLEPGGLRRQRDRYRALGRHVTRTEHDVGRLTVTFDLSTDLELLRYAVEVERECCPFFQIELDVARRRLGISVPESHELALDAIAETLRDGRPAGRGGAWRALPAADHVS